LDSNSTASEYSPIKLKIMRDPCLDQLRYSLGLDNTSGDQRIWRFLPLDRAKDLFKTFELYLCQVSILRNDDPRESRLPTVLHDLVEDAPWKPALKDFVADAHRICESQADSVYASCWFIPGSADQEKRMWDKYGGGLSGGVRIDSTIERLISSLPEQDFGLGMIRYIRPNISFSEAFDLNQYRSMPFLLKLSDHDDDREIRLFTRYRGLPSGKRFVPDPSRLERRGIRVLIDGERLIEKVRISPICSQETRTAIYEEFTRKGVPNCLIDGRAYRDPGLCGEILF
jgi:hypothetical protein